jgi:hypothetical protein
MEDEEYKRRESNEGRKKAGGIIPIPKPATEDR